MWPLDLHKYPSAEAQAAALADDIAYNGHDLDDGLRAGLFSLDQAKAIPFIAGVLAEVETSYRGLEETRRTHELVRRVITRFVEDAIAEFGAQDRSTLSVQHRYDPRCGAAGRRLLKADASGGARG